MTPRQYRYDPSRRKAAMEKTRSRIVRATAELHAKHGVVATSYAMIAKKADVSLPTVYHHFPELGDLIAACSGHVLGQAPLVGPHIFERIDDTDSRLRALVHHLCTFYRFVAPWFRWTYYEARIVPEIAARYKKAAEARRALLCTALAPAFGESPPQQLVALCESLLDFPAWQALTGDSRLSDDEAEAALIDAVATIVKSMKPASLSIRRSST
jgi:AcrR family transcriptional regulator